MYFIHWSAAAGKFKFMVQPLNFLILFLLVGLWHGLTINYIIWGGVHGIAMAIESTPLGRWLKTLWAPLQHCYALVVVLFGWVFFRSATLPYAFEFLARLMGSNKGVTQLPFSVTQPLPIIDHSVWLAFALGILFSMPIMPWFHKIWSRLLEKGVGWRVAGRVVSDLVLIALLVLSVAALLSRATVITSVYQKF